MQTACSDTETSLDGVFTKEFVDFQNSGGAARPSSTQLHSRTPFVYVPWSGRDTVVFKDAHGRANRARPYLHLLADPQHVYRPRGAPARTPAPAPAPAPAPSSSLGRYAAPGKHVVSAAPQPAASTSALKRLVPDTSPSYSSITASSMPALTFTTSMDRLSFEMAVRPLVLMPGLKLLQATPAMLKWRTRMRGEVGP